MRSISMMILLALCTPAMAQIQIGGEFGQSWLEKYGGHPVLQERGGDLWSWGSIPKGQILSGGRLEPMGTSTWYYPSLLSEASLSLLNGTAPAIDSAIYMPPDFTSPYFMDDPWVVAQITGRPVRLQSP
jgi:hypothetical protein